MAESFRDLVAWQKAMALITEIYCETESFPAREIYGLTNQLKGRVSKKEFAQFIANARGSLCEVQTQLEISRNLGYLAPERFDALEEKARETGRILNGLLRSLRASPSS